MTFSSFRALDNLCLIASVLHFESQRFLNTKSRNFEKHNGLNSICPTSERCLCTGHPNPVVCRCDLPKVVNHNFTFPKLFCLFSIGIGQNFNRGADEVRKKSRFFQSIQTFQKPSTRYRASSLESPSNHKLLLYRSVQTAREQVDIGP